MQFSSTAGEYVFETTQGSFIGGGCTGSKRKSTNIGEAATLIMPSAGSGVVEVSGAWALQHGTVHIAHPLKLVEELHPTAPPSTNIKAFSSTFTISQEGTHLQQFSGSISFADIVHLLPA